MTTATPAAAGMIAPAPSTMQVVGQTTLQVAEQMLPVILTMLQSGGAAGAPEVALIEMAAQAIPPLVQSFGANSSQISQLLRVLQSQIRQQQASIDEIAKARGLIDPLVPTTAVA